MENKENAKCCHDEKSCESSCSCGCKSNWSVGIVILALLLLVHAVVFPFAANYVAEKTADKILANEYAKVGGKDVYDLLNKAQAIQFKEQLPQIKTYVESAEKNSAANTTKTDSAATTPTQTTNQDASALKLTQDEITSILKDAYVEGKPTARYLLVEYSDLECPFCIRQYHDGIMKSLEEKYGDNVRHVFKPFRAVPHEGAEPKAVASLCVAQASGADKYAKFYSKIFEASDTQGKVYPVSDLAKLAKEVGADTAKYKSCVDAKQTTALYNAYTAEGTKYGVKGTPGTLIVDTQTGNATLIAGAYPLAQFVSAIDAMK